MFSVKNMRQRGAMRRWNAVKRVKNTIRKLRVENERKITQEFEINQDPFTMRSKKGSGPEIMGPPRNGKHNLFTEVVDIAINFNDFFAPAFRQEHVQKILAKRHVFAYIREEG